MDRSAGSRASNVRPERAGMTNLSSDVARIIGPWKEAILELFRPLSITGIEVTQAIQYGRAAERLTDKGVATTV
jgi:hypothetical protein